MYKTLQSQFVDRLKISGLTQRALSDISGVHFVTISRYVTGTRDIKCKTLDRLLSALVLQSKTK